MHRLDQGSDESGKANVRERYACLKSGFTAKNLLHSEVDVERAIPDLLKRQTEIGLVILAAAGAVAAAAGKIPDHAWSHVCNQSRALTALGNRERQAKIDSACANFAGDSWRVSES